MRRFGPATLLCLCLIAAACGSNGNDSASKSTKGSGASKEPVKIVLIAGLKGKDPLAVPAYPNAASMAVADINASGGINGQTVTLAKVNIGGATPQDAPAAYKEAVQENPTAIIGFPSSSASMAAARDVASGGIPMIAFGSDDQLRSGESSGNKWTYLISPTASSAATLGANFAINTLNAKKIGLLYVNIPFGKQAAAVQKKVIQKGGAEVAADRSTEPTAADVTDQVLAMKDADVVLNWNYPNVAVLALKQMAQNGINAKTVANGAPLLALSQLPKDQTKGLYLVTACAPSVAEQPNAIEWAKRYTAKFKIEPDEFAAQTYDSIFILKKAIEDAKSTAPSKLRDSLGSVEYKDGVCSSDYKADSGNTLDHSQVIVSFATGKPKLVKTVK